MIDIEMSITYDVFTIQTNGVHRLVGTYPCRCVAEDVVELIKRKYDNLDPYLTWDVREDNL